MRVKVLGSAAGGGFPQWNCACSNCARARQKKFRNQARTQTQLAVSAGGCWFLLDASPDLRLQLEADAELVPPAKKSTRATPIAGVVLTGADIDRIMGLLHLREFSAFDVYATDSLHRLLSEDNTIFRVLHREQEQVRWHPFTPGKAFELKGESALVCTPISLKSSYPEYVSPARASELVAGEALVALEIEDPASQKRMIYAPSVSTQDENLKRRIAQCDLLFLDGTFWSDDELQRLRGSGRSAREMGHLPISGDDGSLTWLESIRRPQKIYLHINNTNPVLDESSTEAAKLRDAGWEVGRDGMEFEL